MIPLRRSGEAMLAPAVWYCYIVDRTAQPVLYWIGKVKCTLVQALKLCTGRTAHRGSRGIDLPFLDHGTRRGWGVSVTPRPLFTPGKTRYPLSRRLGGPQGRSGQVQKISAPPEFDPRTVQHVASHYTDYATRPTLLNRVHKKSAVHQNSSLACTHLVFW
jgi:hypothetical protein